MFMQERSERKAEVQDNSEKFLEQTLALGNSRALNADEVASSNLASCIKKTKNGVDEKWADMILKY